MTIIRQTCKTCGETDEPQYFAEILCCPHCGCPT